MNEKEVEGLIKDAVKLKIMHLETLESISKITDNFSSLQRKRLERKSVKFNKELLKQSSLSPKAKDRIMASFQIPKYKSYKEDEKKDVV